jgi:probable F420-dependent oxidoreductase
MDIGISIPQIGALADPAATRSVAQAAETAGFSSVWALDRLLAPVEPRSPYPASPDGVLPPQFRSVLDPIGVLTLAAAVTERIRIGTNVLVAPFYPPVLLARSLTTLDRISEGRLTAGLGLGWSVDEYDAVGVPQRDLGRRMEEILDVLEAVWRDDVPAVRTSREHVPASTIGSKPSRPGGPELLLAAYTPAGLERVARRADGWTPAGVPLDATAPMWSSVRDLAESYGRDPDELRLVVRANVHCGARATGPGRADFCGDVHQVAADVARARELGVDEVILELQMTVSSASELMDLALEISTGSDVSGVRVPMEVPTLVHG